MKWKIGQIDSIYYAICKVANDNGIMASKLNSAMQEIYSFNPIQCVNGKLEICGKKILGDYDFCIYGYDENGVENAMKTAEKLLQYIRQCR